MFSEEWLDFVRSRTDLVSPKGRECFFKARIREVRQIRTLIETAINYQKESIYALFEQGSPPFQQVHQIYNNKQPIGTQFNASGLSDHVTDLDNALAFHFLRS